MLNDLRHRLRSIFRRGAAESDLDQELRSHFEHQVDSYVRSGMPRQEAQRRAQLALGGIEQIKEDCRDERGVRLFDDVVQDLRYALRILKKNPGFTTVAVLTMVLGTGVNTALFTLINAAVFRPTPVADPQHLYELRGPLRAGDFDFCRRNTQTCAHVVAYSWILPSLGVGSSAEITHGNEVSADYFAALGTRAAVGRLFTEEDYRTTAGNAIVINYLFWERKYNRDPGVIGKPLVLSGRSYTIVGVAEPGFIGTLPLVADFWTMAAERVSSPDSLARVLVRLKPGITVAQAEAELTALKARSSEIRGEPKQFEPLLLDSRSTMLPLAPGLVVMISLLTACAGLVLLIACANVANLMLARAAARQREIAVRLSLGAGRARLLRQLLTESALVALIGGILGLLVAAWAMPAASIAIQSQIPKMWGEFSLHLTPDWRVFAYTVALCVMAGVMFGLAPAWQTTQPGVTSALKDGGGGGQWPRSRLRSGLVIAQVASCLLLLINAGLLARSLANAQTPDPGFDADRNLIVQCDIGKAEQAQNMPGRILERVQSIPGVVSAAAALRVPLLSSGFVDASNARERSAIRLPLNHVTTTYFRTLGIPILRGRTFTPDEERGNAAVALISEGAARKLFPGKDALGEQLVTDRGSVVIGVVKETRSVRLAEFDPGYIYVPLPPDRLSYRVHLFVRTNGNPEAMMQPVRQAALELAPGKQILLYPFDLAMGYQRLPAQAGAIVSATLGLLALVLASVGIYGVISYAVSQRTHEIGVRMALGAGRDDVIWTVLRQGMRLVAAGTILGILGALPLAHVLKFVLYGISPLDPWAFLGVPILMAAIAVAAMCGPTLRASRIEPLTALRHE